MNTKTPALFLSDAIRTSFHLPTETLSACDKYYILYWNNRYLYTSLLRSPRIVRENVTYTPTFLSGLSMEELGMNPESSVRLSFRRIRGHKTGYVLIDRTVRITASTPCGKHTFLFKDTKK